MISGIATAVKGIKDCVVMAAEPVGANSCGKHIREQEEELVDDLPVPDTIADGLSEDGLSDVASGEG